MNLKKLFNTIKYIDSMGNLNVEVFGLSQKIDKVKKGDLFFCFKGINSDGHCYASIAKQKGAVALVVEKFLKNINLPQILVKNTRKIMPKVCNNFFNNVSKKLKLIGITGTNGKTTSSTFIYNILTFNNYKAGLIGTNGVEYCNKKTSLNLTTPDTVDLFYIFDEMSKNNIEYVVMEVSAHAIELNKLSGLKFEVGAFTNLTQDHLDFFKTKYNYALTKLKFLNKKYCKSCFINIDDKYGQLFYKLINTKTITYGLNNPADNFAIDVVCSVNGCDFISNIFDEVLYVSSKIPCLFNVYNLLLSLSICYYLGLTKNQLLRAIKNLKTVDGRVNFYQLKNGATVVIDFAHTPDGLEKILQNLSGLKRTGKLITVFGCGGNRDTTKRSKMGEIAYKYSDKVYVTSDNPRYENPMEIIEEIVKNIKKDRCFIFENRKEAILKAIENSVHGDIILIAGKGSEKYQEIKGVKYLYNDKNVVEPYLKKDN